MLACASLSPHPPATNLFITCCSDCATRALRVPIPANLKMRSRSSSFASNSFDHAVATSSGLICLIMALCAGSSWSVAKFHWHGARCSAPWCSTRKSCIHGHGSWDVRTGSSSLNFFQAVFTLVTVISQPPPAECTQVAEGSYHLQLIRSNLDFTLWSAVNRAGISHVHI